MSTFSMIISLITGLTKLIDDYENTDGMDDAALRKRLDDLLSEMKLPDYSAEDAKVDRELATDSSIKIPLPAKE